MVPEETWCGGCYTAFTHKPIKPMSTPYCSEACAASDRAEVLAKVKKAGEDKKRRK